MPERIGVQGWLPMCQIGFASQDTWPPVWMMRQDHLSPYHTVTPPAEKLHHPQKRPTGGEVVLSWSEADLNG